jgi:hypothetical protein
MICHKKAVDFIALLSYNGLLENQAVHIITEWQMPYLEMIGE